MKLPKTKGELEWYILLVQYIGLTSSSTEKALGKGYAWDFAYIFAYSEEDAVHRFRENGNVRCTLKSFATNPRTEIVVHRVERLDDSMERCDLTPKRTRGKV